MACLGNIVVLDKLTADKIAAGEVIERPASVVKELVENSLDAGATQIIVDLGGEDLNRITVSDNGCGMSGIDLGLSIKRHATSKIRSAGDLNRIRTLGFRGEALPSIASVSKLTVQTKPGGNLEGSELEVHGGEILGIKPTGCPEGTTVTVGDLFYNTPVRRKYLKSNRFERSKVMRIITKMALARPDVRFEYNEKGKRKLTSPGTGNLMDAVGSVLGPQIARELLEVDIDTGEIGISGYAGKPTLSRSNRKYQHLFINGRPVKNLAISYAVESAYGELVPRGRYPVYIISLQLPAEKIDANVHPAKLEVRLQDEREIFGVIKNAVRRAVMGRETVSQMVLAKKSMNIGGPKVGKLSFDDPDSHFGKIEEDSTEYANIPYKETWLEPLAQLKNLYILASGPEGLYIVDQHAAHERVLYEQILDKMKKGSYASQMLATPLTLDLSKGQTEMLYKHIIIFREAGFIIEEFGEQSILIRGMPDIGKNFNPENVIMDILDYIENNGGDVDKTTFLKETVSSMACTDAIKDGDSIYSDSMRGLLEDLLSCENPYSCPHGRPTMFNITYKEINKKLQRR